MLTGTPLQNNMGELYSLLNFMMPQLFSSDEDFKEWFDFNQATQENNKKNMEIVESLHKILRPFLLRRTKKDLAEKLPDKIEIMINVNMSPMQFDIYEKLLKSQNIFNERTKANGK